MNLITCNKDCVYQKDGFCNIDGNIFINSISDNNCCYYKKTPTHKSSYNIEAPHKNKIKNKV